MADGQGSKGYETGLLMWMLELKADGEDDIAEPLLIQLRDIVMNSAMGNKPYPPFLDLRASWFIMRT